MADRARALDLPAIWIDCPTCRAVPGALCTSHSGTRERRNNVHQSRTRACQAQLKGGTA